MEKIGEVGFEKEGIFLEEAKNRFLCKVLIDGCITQCYISSSCRLENFIDLRGKKVVLSPTTSKNAQTAYSITAIPFKKNYIILNSSYANKVVFEGLRSRRFSFLGIRSDAKKEYKVDGYKSDIYIPNTKTIIEIKSIINYTSEAVFPTVYSERTLDQLESLERILEKGYKVHFIFVSLNPYTKKIMIDKNTKFYNCFIKCISNGMKVSGFTSELKNNSIAIKRKITVTF